MKKRKKDVVLILESDASRATIEYGSLQREELDDLSLLLGEGRSVNCAKPPILPARPVSNGRAKSVREAALVTASVLRIYHGSVVDGPGRRSVVQLAGCSIRCEGCYVPETHDVANGVRMEVGEIEREVVERRSGHDGVTILGGEPFDQEEALAELVERFKKARLHVVVYSGYMLSELRARRSPFVRRVLDLADILVDGPFRAGLAKGAGEYRGSSNQRMIDLRKGEIVMFR